MKLLAGMSEFFHRVRILALWDHFRPDASDPFFIQPVYRPPAGGCWTRLPPWSLYQTLHGVNYLFSISSMLQINIPLSQALLRMEKRCRKE